MKKVLKQKNLNRKLSNFFRSVQGQIFEKKTSMKNQTKTFDQKLLQKIWGKIFEEKILKQHNFS
jgi:hypothetical protein